MDRRVIEQKLETLRYCVKRVAERCPENADTLARDRDSQDIIALNLSRAVQQCVDIGAHLISHSICHRPAPWVKPSIASPKAISSMVHSRID